MNAFSRFSPLLSFPPPVSFSHFAFSRFSPPSPLFLSAHSPAPNGKYYNKPNDVDGAKKLDITPCLSRRIAFHQQRASSSIESRHSSAGRHASVVSRRESGGGPREALHYIGRRTNSTGSSQIREAQIQFLALEFRGFADIAAHSICVRFPSSGAGCCVRIFSGGRDRDPEAGSFGGGSDSCACACPCPCACPCSCRGACSCSCSPGCWSGRSKIDGRRRGEEDDAREAEREEGWRRGQGSARPHCVELQAQRDAADQDRTGPWAPGTSSQKYSLSCLCIVYVLFR
jgi:hypothetical protein